jgi:hypothetical protein
MAAPVAKTNWVRFASHDLTKGWIRDDASLDAVLNKETEDSKIVKYLVSVFGEDDRANEGYSRIRSLLDFFNTLFTKVAEKIANYLGEDHEGSMPKSIGEIQYEVVMETHKVTGQQVARYLLNICGRKFSLHAPFDRTALWKLNDVPPDGRFTMDIIIIDFKDGRHIEIGPWYHRTRGSNAGPNANGGRGNASSSTSGANAAYGGSRTGAPKASAPKAGAPKASAPKAKAPKAKDPQAKDPKVRYPKTKADGGRDSRGRGSRGRGSRGRGSDAVVADGPPAVVADGAPAVVADGSDAVVADGSDAVVADGAPAVVVDGSDAVVADGAPAVVADGSDAVVAEEAPKRRGMPRRRDEREIKFASPFVEKVN